MCFCSSSFKLSKQKYTNLINKMGMSRRQMNDIYSKFVDGDSNRNKQLTIEEFKNLYSMLRNESKYGLHGVSLRIFNAFDVQRRGYLTFEDFFLGHATTTRGDLPERLQYTYNFYDLNNKGWLDEEDVKNGINCVLDLLGADRSKNDATSITHDCFKCINPKTEGKITKAEFIDTLSKTLPLRTLMNPFN